MTQIKFENQLSYELYEGIDDENPERFDSTDFSLAVNTYHMSMSEDKFLVSVMTVRKVIENIPAELE